MGNKQKIERVCRCLKISQLRVVEKTVVFSPFEWVG